MAFHEIEIFELLLKKSERAIFLGCSFKKSDKERFALSLFTKRVTKSDLLFPSFQKSDEEGFSLSLFTKRPKEQTKEQIAFFYFFALFKE